MKQISSKTSIQNNPVKGSCDASYYRAVDSLIAEHVMEWTPKPFPGPDLYFTSDPSNQYVRFKDWEPSKNLDTCFKALRKSGLRFSISSYPCGEIGVAVYSPSIDLGTIRCQPGDEALTICVAILNTLNIKTD